MDERGMNGKLTMDALEKAVLIAEKSGIAPHQCKNGPVYILRVHPARIGSVKLELPANVVLIENGRCSGCGGRISSDEYV